MRWRRAVLFLGVLALLAYGWVIPQLGFYWDDWFFSWVTYAHDIAGLRANIDQDRPALGPLLGAMYYVLGFVPWKWHVSALVLRWLGSIAACWALRALWVGHRTAPVFAAALFLLCPAFLQQTAALVYLPGQIILILAMLSLGGTMHGSQGSRGRRWALHGMAAMTAFVAFNLAEIYVVIEVIRLSWLLLAARRAGAAWKQACARAVRGWLPYAPGAMAFVAWRLLIFAPLRTVVDAGFVAKTYATAPHRLLSMLSLGALRGALEATVFSWFVPLRHFFNTLKSAEMALVLLLGAAAGGLAVALYGRVSSPNAAKPAGMDGVLFAVPAIVVGAALALLLRLPIVLSTRADRLSITFILCIAVLITSLVYEVCREATAGRILGGLVGLALTIQAANGLESAAAWHMQRSLWWQLSWRAPQVAEGTTLALDSPAHLVMYHESYGPPNFIYSQQERRNRLLAINLDDPGLLWLAHGHREELNTRGEMFTRDPEKVLLVHLPAPTDTACVRIINGNIDELPATAAAPLIWATTYATASAIDTAAPGATPPADLFGSEPAHGWCYLYQRAELARQRHDWQTVTALADEAQSRHLSTEDVSEWLPFLQGYLETQRTDAAAKLIANLASVHPANRLVLQQWLRTMGSPLAERLNGDGRGATQSFGATLHAG